MNNPGIKSLAEKSVFSHLTAADKLLCVLLLLVSFFSYAMIKKVFPAGAFAVISVDNLETARIRLKGEPRLFSFQSTAGPIVVERKEERVRVTKASCPNKICRKMGWIDSSGGIIACVPGRVLILVGPELAEEQEDELDAFTR